MAPSQGSLADKKGSDTMDIRQVLIEATNRWLKPAEVLDILENFQKYHFHLNENPPDRPESGKLFLFDCKVQRYYRKDGHNWRKKPDGRTVKEAHEKLKVGSEQMLACYYAHGEGDCLLQRRVYWRLAERRIVLVHYLEVDKAISRLRHVATPENRSNIAYTASENSFEQSQISLDVGISLESDDEEMGWEDDERPEIDEASTHLETHFGGVGPLLTETPRSFWSQLNEQTKMFSQQIHLTLPDTQHENLGQIGLDQVAMNAVQPIEGFDGNHNNLGVSATWDNGTQQVQQRFHEISPESNGFARIKPEQPENLDSRVFQSELERPNQSVRGFFTRSLGGRMEHGPSKSMLSGFDDLTERESSLESSFEEDAQNEEYLDGIIPAIVEDMHLDSIGKTSLERNSMGRNSLGRGGSFGNWSQLSDFPKLESFGKWANELYGEQADAGPFTNTWSPVFMEEPSRVLFEVNDFSPVTCSTEGGTKVLIVGKTEVDKNHKWEVMFDNELVPAEMIHPGVLKCHAPPHVAGTVRFSVTLDDGLPCSNISQVEYGNSPEVKSNVQESNENLQIRLVHLLMQSQGEESFGSSTSTDSDVGGDWTWLEEISKGETSSGFVQEKLMVMLLREKLANWVKGPDAEARLKQEDYGGLAAIHMVAALGYDWAIPMLARKMKSVDLPDGRGRTALHWAAANGREKVIISLLDAGAMPAPLVKRPDFPEGATPADLASWSGHKGIAARLAEKTLDDAAKQIPYSQLSSMSIKDKVEKAGMAAVNKCRDVVGPVIDVGMEERIKKSAEAAELIKCVDRKYSIRKLGVDWVEVVKTDEVAFELEAGAEFLNNLMKNIAPKDRQAAALKIQQHYRGYKDRAHFQTLRQKVIYLQSLARGKLARQRFLKLRFAVGIVEKVILRWRRRSKGLSFMDNLPHRGKPAQIEGALVVHPLPQELIPRELPKIGGHDDWKNVGGKGAGLQRALGHLTTLVPSLSGRMQYAALQKGQDLT